MELDARIVDGALESSRYLLNSGESPLRSKTE